MDLRQLRYFLAVAQHGSMAAAGRAVNVSQPALGEKVRQLEDELGVILLERHSRGVRLTESGTQFKGHAERILSAVDDAHRAVGKPAQAVAARLTIGLNPTASRQFAADLLDLFHGTSQVRLREGMSNEIQDEVAAGRLDAGFCYDPPAGPYAIVEIRKELLFLVGKTDVVKSKADIPFDELGRYSLVLDGGSNVLRSSLDDTARRRRIKLKVAYEVEPPMLKRRLLLQREQCAIVPYALFAEEIDRGVLNARRVVEPQLRRRLCLVIRRDLDAHDAQLIRTRVLSLGKPGFPIGAPKPRRAKRTPPAKKQARRR